MMRVSRYRALDAYATLLLSLTYICHAGRWRPSATFVLQVGNDRVDFAG
jgi:hypothetical protein